MAREIKTKLVLDGESEYRGGLEASYKTVGQLGRELKLTQARFLDNADSMEANKAKAEALRREIEAQKAVITSLSERIKYADGAYDGNTEAQELYAQKIDKAMRSLGRMEAELRTTESAMAGMESASHSASQSLDHVETSGKEASRGMEKVEASTKQAGEAALNAKRNVDQLSGGFTVLKGTMSNLVSGALRKGADILKEFLQDSVTTSKDLQEVDNVVSTAFGGMTADVKAFAETADTQFGLSSLAAQQYTGKLGAALNAIGLKDKAAEMSKTLTGLSGDLSSFWNMSADDAYSKVFSGVVSGETEGLKSLGVVMSETNLKAYALTLGMKTKYSAMSAAEKVELRYQYVLNATKQAQGDFAKTSTSLANQLRIAALEGENAQAVIGGKLAPSVKRVTSEFNTWMSSDYGKKLIAKTADEAGKLAEGSLKTLGNMLVWVLENTRELKIGAEAIGIGFLSAKVTGFVMSLTNAARVLMETSKSMGLLNAAMAANPAMVVGIAVAALTVGIIALASSYQSLDDKLKNLKLEVPQSSVDAVTTAINDGIAAADKNHEVIVTINADTQGLKEQLDGFLGSDSESGSNLSRKEFKGISKYVKEVVQPDIDAAKKEMGKQKADFQASLLSITDDNGNSVFSSERAAELADGLGTKTQGLIEALEGYKNDYVALAKEIYKDGRTPTEAEIENLNTLLDKIGEVRIKLNEAQDSATQVLKARAERVKSGQGNEKDFGEAVGYTQQTYSNKATDQHASNESAIAQLQSDIDDWNAALASGKLSAAETRETADDLKKAKKDMAAIFTADEKVDTQVFAEQQAELNKLFDGMAKSNPEAAAALANIASMRDHFISVQKLFDEVGNFDGNTDPTKIQGAIDKIGELYKSLYGTELSDSQKADLSENFTLAAQDILTRAQANISTQIANSESSVKDNPLLAYLQTMLDTGSFDNLDVTKLDGGLENAFKAIDLVGRGTSVGNDLVNGITGGIATRAGELTAADLTSLRDAVIEKTRAVFDSHSPARVMYPIGEDVTAGITTGMTDDTAKTSMQAAADTILSTISEALDLTDAGSNAIASFVSGMQSKSATATARAKTIATSAKSAMYLYGSFYGIGQNNMQGFIDGLNSKKASVTGTMSTIMKAAIQAAKDALGQKSPSKVFRGIGIYTAVGYEQGFVEQMDNTERLVHDRMRRLATYPAVSASTGKAYGTDETPRASVAGVQVVQNIYANETSYVGQQREAEKRLLQIARKIGG